MSTEKKNWGRTGRNGLRREVEVLELPFPDSHGTEAELKKALEEADRRQRETRALLDAARALCFAAARLAESGVDARRLVSEAKKVSTENSWEVVNNAMQIMGGIGYTTVYPIERLLRDGRLSMIWTGSNEIMNLLIQHEYYRELNKRAGQSRDVEGDALSPEQEAEKHYG